MARRNGATNRWAVGLLALWCLFSLATLLAASSQLHRTQPNHPQHSIECETCKAYCYQMMAVQKELKEFDPEKSMEWNRRYGEFLENKDPFEAASWELDDFQDESEFGGMSTDDKRLHSLGSPLRMDGHPREAMQHVIDHVRGTYRWSPVRKQLIDVSNGNKFNAVSAADVPTMIPKRVLLQLLTPDQQAHAHAHAQDQVTAAEERQRHEAEFRRMQEEGGSGEEAPFEAVRHRQHGEDGNEYDHLPPETGYSADDEVVHRHMVLTALYSIGGLTSRGFTNAEFCSRVLCTEEATMCTPEETAPSTGTDAEGNVLAGHEERSHSQRHDSSRLLYQSALSAHHNNWMMLGDTNNRGFYTEMGPHDGEAGRFTSFRYGDDEFDPAADIETDPELRRASGRHEKRKARE